MTTYFFFFINVTLIWEIKESGKYIFWELLIPSTAFFRYTFLHLKHFEYILQP